MFDGPSFERSAILRASELVNSEGVRRAHELATEMQSLTSAATSFYEELYPLRAAMSALRANTLHATASADALESVAKRISENAYPFDNSLMDWHKSIAERIARLSTPGILNQASLVGFTKIALLHDLAVCPEPFSAPVGEVFSRELGAPLSAEELSEPQSRESSAIRAGFNAETIAFSEADYSEVLVCAGFEFRLPAMGRVTSECGVAGDFDAQYPSLLKRVENLLRELIAEELSRLEGEQWHKRRVPPDLVARWIERRDTEKKRLGVSYPLVFYADFMDLCQIICRKDNWREAFSRYFVTRDDFQVSMHRLGSIRNLLMHSRPLVRTDQLVLAAESARLLRALGVRL